MRVVTFNIHHGTVGVDGPVDAARLAQACASFDADVIALHEVDQGTWRSGRRDLAAEVASSCGMAQVFGRASRFWGGWFGNAVLVRGTIETSTVTRLPRVPGWKFWQERRSLIQARVRVADASWSIAVTHLAVPSDVNEPQLAHVLDLVGSDGPTVVLGDFNNHPDAVRPAAERAGLRYVEHGGTFPAGNPQVAIDHVLVSPELHVSAVEVRSTPMSDHAALLVDLVG